MAKRLTRAAQMKADRAARKKHFDETKKAQARKGQQGMTLKQRQADDDRIMRHKIVDRQTAKKLAKVHQEHGVKADSAGLRRKTKAVTDPANKKKEKISSAVSKRHGTNKDNLKAIKLKNRPGQAAANVKHQAGNVVNKVKGLFKKKKKKK